MLAARLARRPLVHRAHWGMMRASLGQRPLGQGLPVGALQHLDRAGSVRWMASSSGKDGDEEDKKRSDGAKDGEKEQQQEAGTQSGGGGLFSRFRKALDDEMKSNPELAKAWEDAFGSQSSKKKVDGETGEAGGEGGDGGEGSGSGGSASWQEAQERVREAKDRAAGLGSKARERVGSAFGNVSEKAGSAQEKAKGRWESLRERVTGVTGAAWNRSEEARQRAAEAARWAQEAASDSEFSRESRDAARQAASELDKNTGLLSRVRAALGWVRERMEENQTADKWRDAARDLFSSTDDRVLERKRQREQRRVDMQWQEFEHEDTGYLYYHNPALDVTQWEAPACWGEVSRIRATIANRNAWNEAQKEDAERDPDAAQGGGVAYDGSTSLRVVDQPRTAWQRLSERLSRTPLIQEILGAGEEAKETLGRSAVGRGASAARRTLSDRAEDLRNSWETSQNPWVYTMSTVVDNVFAETETATCMRETKRLDPQFDLYEFQREVQVTMIPEVLQAYMHQETHKLRNLCSEGAYAQIRAALHELKAAGLRMDPTILDIKEADMIAAKVISGDPTFVFTCMVNQINCVRDQGGAVVQGGEDDVRAIFYVFAVQREYSEENAELEWKVVEFGAQGSMETW